MDLTSKFFALISISAIFIFASANQNRPLPPEIKAICGKTSSPDICSSSIIPFLDGKKDVTSVLRMQINAASQTVETAIKESKKHSKDKQADKIASKRLKGCAQLYSSAISYYKDALKALNANNMGTLQTELDAASSMITTCDDTITGDGSLPASVNPLNQINSLIRKMNGNCYDLKKLLTSSIQVQPDVI